MNYKGLRPRFVIVPTNGRACLKDCLQAISPQVDRALTIAGDCQGSEPFAHCS